MSLPGGIRTRMVIVLVGIVAGALGTAYMIVVPSLERRLVDAGAGAARGVLGRRLARLAVVADRLQPLGRPVAATGATVMTTARPA